VLNELLRQLARCEVDERVTKARLAAEIDGKVHEVKRALEALEAQEIYQHRPSVVIGQIPHYGGCASCNWIFVWSKDSVI